MRSIATLIKSHPIFFGISLICFICQLSYIVNHAYTYKYVDYEWKSFYAMPHDNATHLKSKKIHVFSESHHIYSPNIITIYLDCDNATLIDHDITEEKLGSRLPLYNNEVHVINKACLGANETIQLTFLYFNTDIQCTGDVSNPVLLIEGPLLSSIHSFDQLRHHPKFQNYYICTYNRMMPTNTQKIYRTMSFNPIDFELRHESAQEFQVSENPNVDSLDEISESSIFVILKPIVDLFSDFFIEINPNYNLKTYGSKKIQSIYTNSITGISLFLKNVTNLENPVYLYGIGYGANLAEFYLYKKDLHFNKTIEAVILQDALQDTSYIDQSLNVLGSLSNFGLFRFFPYIQSFLPISFINYLSQITGYSYPFDAQSLFYLNRMNQYRNIKIVHEKMFSDYTFNHSDPQVKILNVDDL